MGAAPRHSWLGPTFGFARVVVGPSPIRAEGPLGAVPRHYWLGPGAGFGAVVPKPILAEGRVGAVSHNSWLGPAAVVCWVRSPQSILVEGPVGASPRHSWLGSTFRFAELVGGPSPILAEGPVGAVPRLSWPGPAAVFGLVGGPSQILEEGPVGAVPRRLWLESAFCPWWWPLAIPGGRPCGCCFPPFLPSACCLRLLGGWTLANIGGGPFWCPSSPFLAGACFSPCWGAGWSLVSPDWGLVVALVGRVVPRQSWQRALWVLFPAIPGWGLLLALLQGWYNTVRVMYCIVPIQYGNVFYCISPLSDKVVFVHRSYGPIVCSYSRLVYNLQLFAKTVFSLVFLFPGYLFFYICLTWLITSSVMSMMMSSVHH